MFCRNCDTAIEVSERDVSTFESQGSFECPSCKEDLSARMADLLGANRVPPSEERTVAEEEPADADAFDGLPVGGSLDDAARAMHPSATSSGGVGISSEAAAVPEVAAEDPLTLALRIAQQAQAAALAAAAAAADVPQSNGAAHPESEPIAEATAPGMPAFAATNGSKPAAKALDTAAGASSEVGVVPEEPDNEDTVRRAGNATASTVDSTLGSEATAPEPTLPSDTDMLVSDTSDSGPVIGEETPALTEGQRASLLAEENEPDTIVDEPSQPEPEPERPLPSSRRSVVPDAPSAEPTPSAPRPAPMPAEPREEPTIRKSGPPPALVAPTRLAPRTGTGPAGIGALGFRISSNRPVVRPNGRASSPSLSASGMGNTPAAGTPMSGSTSIERSADRASMERSLDRPSRTGIPAARAPQAPMVTAVPEPPPLVAGRISAAVTEGTGLPVWLLGAGVGVVTLLVGGLAYLLFGGGTPDKPVATPTPTPAVESSPAPTESVVVAVATPVTTVAATATRTPLPTPTPRNTPATPVPPTPTPVNVAQFSPTRPPATPRAASAKERIDQIVRTRTPPVARLEIYQLAIKKENLGDSDLLYESFSFLSKPPSGTKKEEADSSRSLARKLGEEFVARHRRESRAETVRRWIEIYDKTP